MEIGDQVEMKVDMNWIERQSLSMLIEDRTVVGSVDRGLNSTNHIPEVGGNRNR